MNSPFSKDDLFYVLRILKPLRQACCHFQIGNHLMNPQQHVMSLKEIQSNLEESLNLDCEGILRDLVATRNAICGLLVLDGKISEAINEYKLTLKFCEEQKEKNKIDTDNLQLIHCLHNMVEMNQIQNILSSEEIEQAKNREQTESSKYVSRSQEMLMKAVRESNTGQFDRDQFYQFILLADICCHQLSSGKLCDSPFSVVEIMKELKLINESETEFNEVKQGETREDKIFPNLILSYSDSNSLNKIIEACRMVQSSNYGGSLIPPKSRKTVKLSDIQKSINVYV